MLRYVLGVVFLLSHVLLSAPEAWGKDGARTGASARSAVAKKKAMAGKRILARKAAKKTVRAKSAGRTKASARAGRKTVIRASATQGKRKAARLRAPRVKLARRVRPRLSAGELAGLNRTSDPLKLNANAAFVFDPENSKVLFAKNAQEVLPIASITKLMTALVVVEAGQSMNEVLTVTKADIDRIKRTSSRLPIGSKLTRANMLHIALMSSENRAASALGRHYPGGMRAFVRAMNAKAKALGMTHTRYVEPTGLSSKNVSTANDLAKLVIAAQAHPVIRRYSTHKQHAVAPGGRVLQYRNSNRLISSSSWDIVVQKTGYIAEAGRCLVMNAMIDGRPIVMVFLDAKGKFARAADAVRVRDWLKNPDM